MVAPLVKNRAMIRVSVGGWVFAPWRGTFYPPGLPQSRELEYASRQLTAIEINSTFYGSQKPASFRRRRDETALLEFSGSIAYQLSAQRPCRFSP